nr:DUF3592 domain-containing protein [Hymenobacter sp. APR13]
MIAAFVLALKDLRKFISHQQLRKFGLPATATIVATQRIRQKNNPLMRMEIEYKNKAGQIQQAQVFAPDSDDSFDYLIGNEIGVRYDSLRPQNCETEDVLYAEWWKSPLIRALFLFASSCFALGLLCKWW